MWIWYVENGRLIKHCGVHIMASLYIILYCIVFFIFLYFFGVCDNIYSHLICSTFLVNKILSRKNVHAWLDYVRFILVSMPKFDNHLFVCLYFALISAANTGTTPVTTTTPSTTTTTTGTPSTTNPYSTTNPSNGVLGGIPGTGMGPSGINTDESDGFRLTSTTRLLSSLMTLLFSSGLMLWWAWKGHDEQWILQCCAGERDRERERGWFLHHVILFCCCFL